MNSQLNYTEKWISNHNTYIHIRQNNGNHPSRTVNRRKQNKKEKENNIQSLLDDIKHANLRIIRLPEEEREKRIEKVFEEIMAENFSNLKKETNLQVQEAQRVPNKINPNRPTPRYIIIKMAKVKQRILKAAREKQRVTYKWTSIRRSVGFSAETLQAKREGHDIFKVLRGKKPAT